MYNPKDMTLHGFPMEDHVKRFYEIGYKEGVREMQNNLKESNIFNKKIYQDEIDSIAIQTEGKIDE